MIIDDRETKKCNSLDYRKNCLAPKNKDMKLTKTTRKIT